MYFTHVSRGYPRALLDDFTAAKAAFPGKPLIKCILEALLLSRKGLQMDPVQFMPQLLWRLEDNESANPQSDQELPLTPDQSAQSAYDPYSHDAAHCSVLFQSTAEFKQRLREYSSKVWFEPDVNILERTGGQLLHSIHVHASEIDMMTITSYVAYFHGIVHRSSRQEEDRLEHTNDLKGARTVDMVTVVTIAKDNNLRVWDRSRDKKRTTDRQAKSSD
ncbi:hypothetical protein DPMN_003156 [Dreissena polymorpha]|uniref:Uncharacterized protein n=1 Tax=Dreissena polymorpha TaxID=45954 RepID=A0A9D4RUI7_DREPO|nr:hypothetical protein DPMN_003156 [Dreissena polymorpha]